jgi:hypothetical protein
MLPEMEVAVEAGKATTVNAVYLPFCVIGSTDFNGDGDADKALFSPADQRWRVLNQLEKSFGRKGDFPVPGDYDGDLRADIATWRPSAGTWIVRGGLRLRSFGEEGDVPVPADYDGDGKTDPALYRPSEGAWLIHYSSKNSPSGASRIDRLTFGGRAKLPVPADYDGDGKADPATFDTDSREWLVSVWDKPVKYGREGEIPMPADYDGDGIADLAMADPAKGQWRVPGMAGMKIEGNANLVPVCADFDGDGEAEFGFFDTRRAQWHFASTTGFGKKGDIPLNRGK